MTEMSGQEIVRNLADNMADIVAACAEAHPERLSALAHRQKSLTEAIAMSGAFPHADVEALQELVGKAMEAVKAEMGMNRGSMQATGIKKKVLSAYGTVTVSNTP